MGFVSSAAIITMLEYNAGGKEPEKSARCMSNCNVTAFPDETVLALVLPTAAPAL